METVQTSELEKILKETHPKKVSDFLSKNSDAFISEEKPFSSYVRSLIKDKGLRQQDIFIQADIPERYGYKLLSEEKRTKQRDIILRLCYASKFTLDETQKALRLYEMPELYAKVPRDAILMIAFNERPGSIIEVNELLKENGQPLLRTSGLQD